MNHFEQSLYIRHKTGNIGRMRFVVMETPEEDQFGNKVALIETYSCKKVKSNGKGKETKAQRFVYEGKNIGRSNETSPLQQAVSEIKSNITSHLERAWQLTYDAAVAYKEEKKLSSEGFIFPMTAQTYTAGKTEVRWPCFSQPKLDGHRCMAQKVNGEVKMWSRNGKQIHTLPHIHAVLEEILPEGLIVDGELYIHGVKLQKIGSYVKKQQRDSDRVSYNIYDCVLDGTYSDRYNKLASVIQTGLVVKLVETIIVEDAAAARKYHDECVEHGYEGSMLRQGDYPYEDDHRSKGLLKVKLFTDAEFKILDIKLGTPRFIDNEDGSQTRLEVPIYTLEAENGKPFNATAEGTMYEKDAVWADRNNRIGKLLTVKYFMLTEDGIPFLPVALRMYEPL